MNVSWYRVKALTCEKALLQDLALRVIINVGDRRRLRGRVIVDLVADRPGLHLLVRVGLRQTPVPGVVDHNRPFRCLIQGDGLGRDGRQLRFHHVAGHFRALHCVKLLERSRPVVLPRVDPGNQIQRPVFNKDHPCIRRCHIIRRNRILHPPLVHKEIGNLFPHFPGPRRRSRLVRNVEDKAVVGIRRLVRAG